MRSRRRRASHAADESATLRATDSSHTPPASPDQTDQRSRASPVAGAVDLATRLGNAALERLLGERGGRGSPLDRHTAAAVGASFGADLSGVKIVEDAGAKAAARVVNAVAFTAGEMIFVGDAAPPLSSPAGETLLAHELAHIVQQRDATAMAGATVNEAGDAHEAAADAASHHATHGAPAVASVPGPVPAIQRQPAPDLSITKTAMLSRADVQDILQRYLEKKLRAQGGKTVRVTEDIKNDIRRVFLNDLAGVMRIDSYLDRSIFPGDPAELARAIAQFFPEQIDPQRVAHLGASSGPPPSKMERVGEVVKKTAPYESPDTLERKWEFERQTKEARKGEGAIGPFGVDVERLYNIGKQLPGALKTPAEPKAEARTYPEVEAAIEKISKSALTPGAAKGTQKADQYADAQLVARDLARQLDLAHQQHADSVPLRLGANYNSVKDRAEMINEVVNLVRTVRDALPHHAGGVSTVELYFGDRVVRRIPLIAAE